MTTRRIDIHSTFVATFAHSFIIFQAIGQWWHHPIVGSHKQYGRRSEMTTHGIIVRPFFHKRLIFTTFAKETNTRAFVGFTLVHRDNRINQDREVRTSIERSMGANRRSKMSTCREAHDTNIVWIYMPLCSAISNCLYRIISI